MSTFRIRQKVVCIIRDTFCNTTKLHIPSPEINEIVTIEWMGYIDGEPNIHLGFEEYGDNDCWNSAQYRPLDDSQTEELCAMILEANKEELIKI